MRAVLHPKVTALNCPDGVAEATATMIKLPVLRVDRPANASIACIS